MERQRGGEAEKINGATIVTWALGLNFQLETFQYRDSLSLRLSASNYHQGWSPQLSNRSCRLKLARLSGDISHQEYNC